jgi:hypothetical protein
LTLSVTSQKYRQTWETGSIGVAPRSEPLLRPCLAAEGVDVEAALAAGKRSDAYKIAEAALHGARVGISSFSC